MAAHSPISDGEHAIHQQLAERYLLLDLLAAGEEIMETLLERWPQGEPKAGSVEALSWLAAQRMPALCRRAEDELAVEFDPVRQALAELVVAIARIDYDEHDPHGEGARFRQVNALMKQCHLLAQELEAWESNALVGG
jgi:hypothetical protein